MITFLFCRTELLNLIKNLKDSICNKNTDEFDQLLKQCPTNYSQLHEVVNHAIKEGNHEILKCVVDFVDESVLSHRDEAGKTSLHHAISKKDVRCCRILMDNRNLLFEKDNNGDTPLHCITRDNFIEGCKEALKWPLAENDHQPTSKYSNSSLIKQINNKNGQTAVHIAASEHNDETILKILLENGGKPVSKTRLGQTSLHCAIEKGYVNCVSALLNSITEADRKPLINAVTNDKSTALTIAAKKGFSECCSLLQDADLDHHDNQGNTALHYAAQKGSKTIVEYLLDKKAKTDIRNNKKQTALCLAAAGDHVECMKLFLDKTVFIDKPEDLLHIATSKKSLRTVEELLSREEFIKVNNTQDRNGDTCLHIAIKQRLPEIALALLSCNPPASKEICNNRNEYPLHLAAMLTKGPNRASQKWRDVLCNVVFKRSHPIVNKCTVNGDTPLHLAAKSGNILAVRALILRGCQITSKNSNGLTAIHLSAENGHNEALEILLAHLKKRIEKKEIQDIRPHPLHLAAINGSKQCCEIILEELEVSLINFILADKSLISRLKSLWDNYFSSLLENI